MRTNDIVIRLHGEDAPKLEIGNSDNYADFYRHLQQSISSRNADIVHKGDYFRYDQHLLPKDGDGFMTYVLFRELTLNDSGDDSAIWGILANEANRLDFPEVREHNEHHQLIELSAASDFNDDLTDDKDQDREEILIRIPGSREELEFDPSGTEGNTILYDRLAKLIYDREAEIMYKGPKLIFEDNRDLFINPDAFSVYILFRSDRSSNYDDNDSLWANLASDLKVLSSITLLRLAPAYQVLLFTHSNEAVRETSNNFS